MRLRPAYIYYFHHKGRPGELGKSGRRRKRRPTMPETCPTIPTPSLRLCWRKRLKKVKTDRIPIPPLRRPPRPKEAASRRRVAPAPRAGRAPEAAVPKAGSLKRAPMTARDTTRIIRITARFVIIAIDNSEPILVSRQTLTERHRCISYSLSQGSSEIQKMTFLKLFLSYFHSIITSKT